MELLTKSPVLVMISTSDYDLVSPETAIMVDISHWRVHEIWGILFLVRCSFSYVLLILDRPECTFFLIR